MIEVTCEQGTPEWMEVRRGVLTASDFGSIITPTGKVSAQSKGLVCRLVAEWMGECEDSYTTAAMERGHMLEPKAAEWYAFFQDVDLREVGHVYLDDDRLIGCSPDRLVGDDGGLELKCPLPKKQIETLLSGKVPPEHKPQIQGNLWITGRKWWDFVSFCPHMPEFCKRVERDEKYIETLAEAAYDVQERVIDALSRWPGYVSRKADGRFSDPSQRGAA